MTAKIIDGKVIAAELRDRRDELVAGIHHVEGDQPGQDRGGDQQPDVEIEHDDDDVENGTHGF